MNLLKSKTLYLSVMLAVNCGLIVTVAVITSNNNSQGTVFIPSSSTSDFKPNISSRYQINSKSFTLYEEYKCTISEDDDLYSTYTVETTDIKAGEEITAGDLIGRIENSDVVSKHNAICFSVDGTTGNFKVTTYNYDRFTVNLDLTSSEYYRNSFHDQNDIYIKVNGSYYDLEFEGYNFDYFVSNSIIKANFRPFNCRSLVNINTDCSLAIIEKNFASHLYLPASIFEGAHSKLFYVIESEDIIPIYVNAVEIIEDYALIDSSYKLSSGMYLYLYE